MAKPKVLARVVQFYAGLDLMGSKMSSNSRDAELEITPIGVKITSKKTKRVILIPWANIKGVELIPQADFLEDDKNDKNNRVCPSPMAL